MRYGLPLNPYRLTRQLVPFSQVYDIDILDFWRMRKRRKYCMLNVSEIERDQVSKSNESGERDINVPGD